MNPAGTRNAIEPETHMNAPAPPGHPARRVPKSAVPSHRSDRRPDHKTRGMRKSGVLKIRREQIRDHRPSWERGPRRPRLHHRPPEQQRRPQKTEVFKLMPTLRTQCQLVKRRNMRGEVGDNKERSRKKWMHEKAPESMQGRRSQKRPQTVPDKPPWQPVSNGSIGNPRQDQAAAQPSSAEGAAPCGR